MVRLKKRKKKNIEEAYTTCWLHTELVGVHELKTDFVAHKQTCNLISHFLSLFLFPCYSNITNICFIIISYVIIN